MNHEVLQSGCGNRHCFWSYLNDRHSAFESFQVDHSLTQSNFITGMPWIAWSFARCLKEALCRHLKGSLYAVLPHTLSRELWSPKVFLIREVQQAFPHFPLYTLAGKLSQDSKLEKRKVSPHIFVISEITASHCLMFTVQETPLLHVFCQFFVLSGREDTHSLLLHLEGQQI